MKKKIVLLLNILIIILELIGITYAFKDSGFSVFQYYTQDSNLMMLIASVLFVFYNIKGKKLPLWVSALKYMATVSVLLTFIVVLTILPWSMNVSLKVLLFSKSMLYLHSLCPILAVISFIFFEKYELNTKRQTLESLYFTFLYAIIIIPLNFIKVLEGPYPFLMVYRQPIYMSVIWWIIIISVCYMLSLMLKVLNKRFNH